MKLCTVAFMLFKHILRILFGKLLHITVTGYLCKYWCRRYWCACCITLDNSRFRYIKSGRLIAVDKCGIRLYIKTLVCSFHSKHSGIKYIHTVDFFDRRCSYAVTDSFLTDNVKQGFTLFLGQLFAVIYPVNDYIIGKYNSRRIDIARKRSSACFVNTADNAAMRSHFFIVKK